MIGILADSQGDLAAFAAAYRLLCAKGARRFIFAGGRYGDLDDWIAPETVKARFVRVTDKGSLEYREDSAPRLALDLLGDALCCVVHDRNDLTRDDLLNATVFLHGKGAEPNVVQIGPHFFITPGMLSGAAEQTCAFLSLEDRNLRFSAFRLDGKVLVDNQLLVLDRRTKMSVK